MAEPDGMMNGPAWPSDWNTGWVTWWYSDMVGQPVVGTMTLSLSVTRAVSRALRATVWGGNVIVPNSGLGRPSGPLVVVNSRGVPCIEVPLGNDPDVDPAAIQLLARESWSGTLLRKTVTAQHTLEDPLWLSGDLQAVAAQPGVVGRVMWEISEPYVVPPPDAAVGDWLFYVNGPAAGLVTEIEEL